MLNWSIQRSSLNQMFYLWAIQYITWELKSPNGKGYFHPLKTWYISTLILGLKCKYSSILPSRGYKFKIKNLIMKKLPLAWRLHHLHQEGIDWTLGVNPPGSGTTWQLVGRPATRNRTWDPYPWLSTTKTTECLKSKNTTNVAIQAQSRFHPKTKKNVKTLI